jgi:hypothetical protein
MLWGSRYTIDITYGDTTVESYYINLTKEGEYLTYSHAYNTPNKYAVTLTFTNRFGVFVLTKRITVQHPVLAYDFNPTSPVVLSRYFSSYCSMSISFNGEASGIPLATEPGGVITFGDGSKYLSMNITAGSNTPQTFVHQYQTYGDYNVTAVISNLVSQMTFQRVVRVDQIPEIVLFYAEPHHVVYRETTKLKVQMTLGTRMTLKYSMMDGNEYIQYHTDYNSTMEVNHTYQQVGVFAVGLYTNNSLGTWYTPMNESIIVQHPIVNMRLTCTPESNLTQASGFVNHVKCRLWILSGTAEPTDVYMQVGITT